MANIGLDTTQYNRTAPAGGPLPPAVYTMTVVRSQSKETNDKQGVYVEVEFDVAGTNRKFWDRFNIINKNPKAQQIGREGVSDLAKAAGINGVLNDDQDLLGKTVQGRLIVKPSDNPQYPEPKNECRKYYPVGVDAEAEDRKAKGGTPAQASAAPAKANWNTAGTPAAEPVAAPAPAGTAPWKR